jgi:hypothetical protein
VIRVGLARTEPHYGGVSSPFDPGKDYPELSALLGDGAASSPPNPAYAGVRAALRGLGLDAPRFGSSQWNPLGGLVARGGRVVLKPNFIRHWNPTAGAGVESVITHGAILRSRRRPSKTATSTASGRSRDSTSWCVSTSGPCGASSA